MATRGSYVHDLYGRILGGIPIMIVLCNFLTKIDGFEQKYSQGFENSYNSHEQYPLEKFFIFTIYQNHTLALIDDKSASIDIHYGLTVKGYTNVKGKFTD